ncbi:hypothetical protein B9D04_03940 [Weissella cibaria]|uniref:Uncharacterized protein n=1 Tax=Weissella cibaria TaxID=137591 RepID=A0A1X4JLP8_9LACO|nr:hypothetical protein [Weissella cibaria]MCQ9619938.1 hypothetical protein [Weissella cibaria]OSP89682.1 hypothetical protein B9D04_03940 [Weissella cibaria]
MQDEKEFLIRHIKTEDLDVIDREAERNGLTRTALVQMILESFVKNVQSVDATEILAYPLQDVTQQLNQLTFAISNSNHNISQDLNALKDVIQRNNLVMAEQTQIVNALLDKIRR